MIRKNWQFSLLSDPAKPAEDEKLLEKILYSIEELTGLARCPLMPEFWLSFA